MQLRQLAMLSLGFLSVGAIHGEDAASERRSQIAITDNRPNLLWIIADDLGPELACYGYQGVSTPNLDRLAAEGVRYTRAFSTSPVCSASRSAVITGMYQTSTGTHQHRAIDAFPDLPQNVVPLTKLLQNAGYYTTNQSDLLGFRADIKVDYNFNHDPKELFNGDDFRDAPAGKAFFAQVQMYPPHRPFLIPPVQDRSRFASALMPPYFPDHPLVRVDWSAYLLSIEKLDQLVGATLEQLEKSGLADNTIVVFFGDNGRPHLRNKQWLYEGGLHTPLIIRWPGHLKAGEVSDDLVSLIDLAPTCLEWMGLPIPSWMQGISFADHPSRSTREYVYAARDRCGEAEDRIRSVRDKRFKYIRNFRPDLPYMQSSVYKDTSYPAVHVLRALHARGELSDDQERFMADSRPGEELYDLEADPHELRNLAEDVAFNDQLVALRDQLDKWIVETGDQGDHVEDPDMVQSYRDERAIFYKNWLKEQNLPEDATPEMIMKAWEKHYAD